MYMDSIQEELEEAILRGNVDQMKVILNADKNAQERLSHTQGMLLPMARNGEIVKELLSRGATDSAAINSLLDAVIREDNLQLVKTLLGTGIFLNTANTEQETPLHVAVKQPEINYEIVKELLLRGAGISFFGYDPALYSPLYTAITQFSSLTCAKFLIKYALLYFCSNRGVSLKPYRKMEQHDELWRYSKDCVSEILQMKMDRLIETEDKDQFYRIGLGIENTCKKYTLYGNRLAHRLARMDYTKRYPIYHDVIMEKLEPILERVHLLDKLGKIQFSTDTVEPFPSGKMKRIVLDDRSIYHITEFLSNEDLSNFIEAFTVSTKRCFAVSNSPSSNDVGPSTSASINTKRPRLQ